MALLFASPGRRRSRVDDRQPDYPAELVQQVARAGLPAPVRELAFSRGRRWRFDLAWPSWMLAIEVDGGTFSRGRHTRGVGYERDCEKLNEAVLNGWHVLRVTGAMVEDGRALVYVERALRPRAVR